MFLHSCDRVRASQCNIHVHVHAHALEFVNNKSKATLALGEAKFGEQEDF